MDTRTRVPERARDPRKESLRGHWKALQTLPTGLTRAELGRWKQDRGYRLEELLVGLARLEKLDVDRPYRDKGEQVDGYFVVDHRHFLLEAKWHENPVTASQVYAFQGKLHGKLLGTLGLFVSISGFAGDAPSALVFGKQIDVLLVDRDDIEFALSAGRTFKEMVRVKVRAAAQTGNVYCGYKRWLDMNP